MPVAIAAYVGVFAGLMIAVVRLGCPLQTFIECTGMGLSFPFSVWVHRIIKGWWKQRKIRLVADQAVPAQAGTAEPAVPPAA